MKRIITLLLCAGLLTLTGCGVFSAKKLEAGGAYAATDTQAAMPELFVADSAFKTADLSLTVVFDYEMNNEAALWAISPNIKHKLDEIRIKAWDVKRDYILARAAYLANRTPANLDTLNAVLAKLNQLNAVAGTVIANKGN